MPDALPSAASGPTVSRTPEEATGPRFDGRAHPAQNGLILLAGLAGLAYGSYSLIADMSAARETPLALGAFALLGLALLIALGFEFVNGFHDTANAVATVIYTRALPPSVAVVWSGAFNFLGVVLSSGAVAYAIVALLPVELVLQVGSEAGYAMVFALLVAAIVWNLGTWAFGLPNSSSHALIGSVLGVGLANQFVGGHDGTSKVDWAQGLEVLKALAFSPVCGFLLAALLMLVLKRVARGRELDRVPEGEAPPPLPIRCLLILTCTLVSFFHGGNDGQKGMGLIMLILIGAAPTAYALNRTMTEADTPGFVQASRAASGVFAGRAADAARPTPGAARAAVGDALKTKALNRPAVFAALASLSDDIAGKVQDYGSLRLVPAAATPNLRNDMYLASDAIRRLTKAGAFGADEAKVLNGYVDLLDAGTRYIPGWVKVCVALALSLGTMVGWRRIVVTVGERIGKQHLTYAQGASAEIVAAGTIGLAEGYGLPVSTTHILSSGVAGTMAVNGSGLQLATVRSLALAWILTLPAAMLLAGTLFVLLRQVV
ncbi:inorganic phosphate transporter [Methylobacterium gregans]|uniref:Phosphate transporter n=1 Tax=Methylobacterium gregans TaxID=374424 RepID=A0AA37HU20_9HYPH|nr:inorganic phosphate transporter [Methylobacterium gregans]MDQ0521769.1 PiT family inorganic phosphate transporter [Methylobacterium gregans]GJD81938.1 Low-affinity inorganic phosphate transporter 1 [Methylobacterium gregans]GLS55032.1 phosphate transporter [Methylobacterium gregans]